MERVIEGDFYKNLDTKKTTRIRGSLINQLGQVGTEGEVGFYNLEIIKKQTYQPTSLRVCIKEINIDTFKFSECTVDEILKKYLLLKNIGLPVVPFLRCDGKKRILMTDLTNNGKSEVIDSHLPKPENIEIKNIGLIKKESYEAANLAFENGIFLYQDAYAVVVDKQTRIGRFNLIDIGRKTKIDNDCFYDQEFAFEQVNQFIDLVL
jgi:hypothetical protein